MVGSGVSGTESDWERGEGWTSTLTTTPVAGSEGGEAVRRDVHGRVPVHGVVTPVPVPQTTLTSTSGRPSGTGGSTTTIVVFPHEINSLLSEVKGLTEGVEVVLFMWGSGSWGRLWWSVSLSRELRRALSVDLCDPRTGPSLPPPERDVLR